MNNLRAVIGRSKENHQGYDSGRLTEGKLRIWRLCTNAPTYILVACLAAQRGHIDTKLPIVKVLRIVKNNITIWCSLGGYAKN